jgi:hypothetical protein
MNAATGKFRFMTTAVFDDMPLVYFLSETVW